MASKKKIQKAVKKATTKSSGNLLGSLASKAKSAVGMKSALGGKGKGGFRRHHKKSAMWYAKEIARIKLKRRYDKIRYKF